MLKFKDLALEDYSSIIESPDSSEVHYWLKSWILRSVSNYKDMDFSQKSFQWYLDTYINKEYNTERISAYEILKTYKDLRRFPVLDKIKLVPPRKKSEENKDFKSPKEEPVAKIESVKSEREITMNETSENYSEAPKILTDTNPQIMTKWLDMVKKEKEKNEQERQKLEEEMLSEHRRSIRNRVKILIAVGLIGVVICAFVLFIK